ncbi:hypothetical protein GCM10017562_02800 [Streptomyces roseofulvus]
MAVPRPAALMGRIVRLLRLMCGNDRMANFHPIPFDSLHNLDSAAVRSTQARTTGTSSRSDDSRR